MKTGNRIWALILALAMVLSMGVTAFAQDSGEEVIYEAESFIMEDTAPARMARSSTSFYDQLSSNEKLAYDELSTALKNPQISKVVLSFDRAVTKEEIVAASRALQMDHPEKYYWVNKTDATSIITGGNQGFIYFQVISSYNAGKAGEDTYNTASGEIKVPYYSLQSGDIEEARTVAQGIVDGCAGLTPYEKVVKFNTWLCDNVSYADEAVNAAYGNASQMVGAFVSPHRAVCEGYAKAFKYLCDLAGIDCEIVTGLGKGDGVPGGQGNHMWNYVRLDGNWYLVDTTWNCTSGSPTMFLCVGSDTDAGQHDPKNNEQGANTDATSLTLSKTDYDPDSAPVAPVTYKITMGALTGLTVTGAPATAKQGDEITLKVSVNEGYEKPFTLSVNGKALAENAASFTMPAENVTITGSAAASADIDVKIEPSFIKLTVGESSLLTAKVTMKDGSDYTGDYNWHSDGSIAEISETEDGNRAQRVVTAVKEGTATVLVTVIGNRSVTATATVQVGETAVEPEPTPNPEPEPKPEPNPGPSVGGGSSSDSSSSEHGWWDERDAVEQRASSSSSSKTDEKSVQSLTRAALKAAKAGQTPVVNLRNSSTIARSVLQSALKTAGEKGLLFHIDTVKKNAVESRLYLRPSLLKGGEKDILKLGVTINMTSLKKVFDQYYKNNLHLITFSQKGGFGGAIEVAAKLDLSSMNTKNLVFYHYDSASNTFYKLSGVKYFMDANGYLHIQNLSNLDTIIVTDGPMVRK